MAPLARGAWNAGGFPSPALRRARRARHGSRPPEAAARRLIVANHVSWLDIPVLGSIEPMTFLAKKEVGAPALGGRLARLQGVIFVDRGRRRGIPQVNAEMARAMASGEPVVLFAEATTGDGNRILRFRSSHFEAVRRAAAAARRRRGDPAGVPRLFAHRRPAGRSTRAAAVRLVRRHDLPAAFPAFRRRRGPTRCDVYYGAPIPVSAETGRKSLARRTEADGARPRRRGPGRRSRPIPAGAGSS